MRRLNLLYLAGLVVIALCMANPNPASAALYGDYLSTISTGNLNQPAKVAVDQANGDVYVTDAGNKQVKKFDKNGNYAATFTLTVAGTPVGIAVNANNIFVGDDTNDCIWIYDKNGNLTDLSGTGTSHKLGGASGTAVKMPNTVVVAPSGHIFVADGDSDDCLIYNADGTYNSSFGTSGSGLSTGTTIYCYFPSGIAMANNSVSGTSVTQYFYMGDQGNYRVQKLHYIYNSSTKAITTAPTFDQNIGSGTRADAFGSFLRLSDVVCDNTGRLIALDSLQMVGQIFQSDALYTNTSNQCKDASNNVAINYCTSAVVGNLNVPTGAAVYMGDASTTPKLYVANNQNNNLVVYNTQDGAVPTLSITDPTTAVVPCTATYTVSFSGTDADSNAETVKLYYYNTSNPSVKTLFSTQPVTVAGGSFTGSATLDLVGTYPYMTAGTYGIYGEVTDEKNNLGTADSGPAGTVGITNVAGEGNYTCSMAAKWGDGLTTDTDGDGLSNADEINGTYNTAFANAPTDPTNADTDGDGLDDGVEEGVVAVNLNKTVPISYTGSLVDANGKLINHTNPNSKDTDNGGTSDAVELAKGTNPSSGGDDLVVASSPQDGVSEYFIGDSQLLDSFITFQNSTANNIVVDLDFYNLNGTLIKTVPGIFVAPHQLITKNPYADYAVTEGSVEIRATSPGIRIDLTRTRKYYAEPLIYDDGAGMNMSLPADAGTTQYISEYGDSAVTGYRFYGTTYIKNWSDSSANVTVNYSDGENISNPIVTKTYVLAGHETIAIRPSSDVTYRQGALVATSDQPITVLFYMERWNATDPQTYDICYGEKGTKSLSSYYYTPNWADSTVYYADTDTAHNGGWLPPQYDFNYRYINWIYMHNFSSTNTINITAKFYDMSGNLVLTKTYTLPPNGQQNIRPAKEGATNQFAVLANPSLPLVVQGSAEFSADGPFLCINWLQRLNTGSFNYDAPTNQYKYMGTSIFDYSYLVPLESAPRTTQYVSSYYDWLRAASSYPNDYLGWVQVYNPSATATANLTVTYYNPDGTVNSTVTGSSVQVAPHANKAWKPFGTHGAAHVGSIRIDSDLPFVGLSFYQRWRYNDYNYFDYSIGRPMW